MLSAVPVRIPPGRPILIDWPQSGSVQVQGCFARTSNPQVQFGWLIFRTWTCLRTWGSQRFRRCNVSNFFLPLFEIKYFSMISSTHKTKQTFYPLTNITGSGTQQRSRFEVQHFQWFCEPEPRTCGPVQVRTEVREVLNRTAVSLRRIQSLI